MGDEQKRQAAAEAAREKYVAETVAAFPPLADEQIHTVARLLNAGRPGPPTEQTHRESGQEPEEPGAEPGS